MMHPGSRVLLIPLTETRKASEVRKLIEWLTRAAEWMEDR
jgi:hypothetical protein